MGYQHDLMKVGAVLAGLGVPAAFAQSMTPTEFARYVASHPRAEFSGATGRDGYRFKDTYGLDVGGLKRVLLKDGRVIPRRGSGRYRDQILMRDISDLSVHWHDVNGDGTPGQGDVASVALFTGHHTYPDTIRTEDADIDGIRHPTVDADGRTDTLRRTIDGSHTLYSPDKPNEFWSNMRQSVVEILEGKK